jgi:hypothetical protein
MAKAITKYKGFSYEDESRPLAKVAYMDGYAFGDTLLEGVPFKCEVTDSGELQVGFAEPTGFYEQELNQPLWNARALKYAKEEDVFYENAELTAGEDLYLEKAD